MPEYWGSVRESSNFIRGYMCQSTGGVCMRKVTLYRVHMSEYWGSVHETSNFIQIYMCQSTGGMFKRQVTLYRVTCVRVLGECVGDK